MVCQTHKKGSFRFKFWAILVFPSLISPESTFPIHVTKTKVKDSWQCGKIINQWMVTLYSTWGRLCFQNWSAPILPSQGTRVTRSKKVDTFRSLWCKETKKKATIIMIIWALFFSIKGVLPWVSFRELCVLIYFGIIILQSHGDECAFVH